MEYTFQPGQRVMICKEHDALHATVIECGEKMVVKFDELSEQTIVEPWQLEQFQLMEEED